MPLNNPQSGNVSDSNDIVIDSNITVNVSNSKGIVVATRDNITINNHHYYHCESEKLTVESSGNNIVLDAPNLKSIVFKGDQNMIVPNKKNYDDVGSSSEKGTDNVDVEDDDEVATGEDDGHRLDCSVHLQMKDVRGRNIRSGDLVQIHDENLNIYYFAIYIKKRKVITQINDECVKIFNLNNSSEIVTHGNRSEFSADRVVKKAKSLIGQKFTDVNEFIHKVSVSCYYIFGDVVCIKQKNLLEYSAIYAGGGIYIGQRSDEQSVTKFTLDKNSYIYFNNGDYAINYSVDELIKQAEARVGRKYTDRWQFVIEVLSLQFN